ncbi:MAG: hypothetical protein AAB866_03035 [Patescibacteria group bacterium]
MVQKCFYCGREIPDDSVLTVCHVCGIKVWGEKMFNTIKKNMENARDSGDLCHMNNSENNSKKKSNF